MRELITHSHRNLDRAKNVTLTLLAIASPFPWLNAASIHSLFAILPAPNVPHYQKSVSVRFLSISSKWLYLLVTDRGKVLDRLGRDFEFRCLYSVVLFRLDVDEQDWLARAHLDVRVHCVLLPFTINLLPGRRDLEQAGVVELIEPEIRSTPSKVKKE